METAMFLDVLTREGELLAAAAESAGCDAPVPTCPGWRVRDLVTHTGVVHRWAERFVAERDSSFRPMEDGPDLDGAALLDWFRDGHRRLAGTLRAAPADLACWHFMPAPSSLAFWARRQAHETAVHRVDAEAARGGARSGIAADFAVDGIDELLRGFHARDRSRVRSEKPRTLRVRATDAGNAGNAVWTVRLSQEPPVTERGDAGDTGDADCELTGTAEALYLGLWNRQPIPNVTGDTSLAVLWQERSGVN
ncbi:maleylpyruvate isomerase family mycothiol-dependent enzyme [Streptomyces ziwulingensis]